jgi:hypothetical protein
VSTTATKTATYTDADVAKCMTSVRADLMMIGDSTGGLSEQEARDYADDIEVLAKAGYLEWVDVTLLSYGVEQRAARFTPSADASGWTSSRPGGVRWPRVAGAEVRVVIKWAGGCTPEAKAAIKQKLRISWGPTDVNTDHANLNDNSSRDYASNAFGMRRKDWSS